MKTITLKKGEKLTIDQAIELFGSATIDEQRGDITTRGPWNTISGFKALCVRQDFDNGDIIIYGYRRLQKIRQGGYELEGRVSIGGKEYTAFTSSHLFELENGHLIDVATIFPRIKS
jgi:hypothetical protein